VTTLGAFGISTSLPAGFEGRVFRRPAHGEVAAAAADGQPAPAGQVPQAIMHAATIPLPPDVGDFASGVVQKLGTADVIVVLFEYAPESIDQPLFGRRGVPRMVAADDFSPSVLQRTVTGQAGLQVFAQEAGRAFCLYVVIGSYARRADLVAEVNALLATLVIDPLPTAAGAPSTVPPTSTTPSSTTTTTTPPTSTSSPRQSSPPTSTTTP
jgi:hypothetical protein